MAPGAPPLAAIVGPTASGKSDLALAVARRLPVEIIVADSRQVYRGMDVGTAKPDEAARAQVAHHLLDQVAPDEPFSAADWVLTARRLVSEIAGRGRLPLVVGGTGLYLKSLIDGHDYEGGAPSPQMRARLAGELEDAGLGALAERLVRLAPDVAAGVDLHNPRRVLRALERVESGGGGVVKRPGRDPYPGRIALVGIQRPREVLRRRIDERAERIWAGGLLDEVRRLIAAGYGPELEPMTGHGYREAARHLAGEWTRVEAVEEMARRTRQYARRQTTWFRRDVRIAWLDAGDRPADDPAVVDVALRILGPLLATGPTATMESDVDTAADDRSDRS